MVCFSLKLCCKCFVVYPLLFLHSFLHVLHTLLSFLCWDILVAAPTHHSCCHFPYVLQEKAGRYQFQDYPWSLQILVSYIWWMRFEFKIRGRGLLCLRWKTKNCRTQSSASHVDWPLGSTPMPSWLAWSVRWSRGCQSPFILLWGTGLVTGVRTHLALAFWKSHWRGVDEGLPWLYCICVVAWCVEWSSAAAVLAWVEHRVDSSASQGGRYVSSRLCGSIGPRGESRA